ncbi:MAG: hypothetical protein SFW35_00485 [Chitinophagales bacterium]|nr:hypothetical protein [Chitinophagales bacterium]
MIKWLSLNVMLLLLMVNVAQAQNMLSIDLEEFTMQYPDTWTLFPSEPDPFGHPTFPALCIFSEDSSKRPIACVEINVADSTGFDSARDNYDFEIFYEYINKVDSSIEHKLIVSDYLEVTKITIQNHAGLCFKPIAGQKHKGEWRAGVMFLYHSMLITIGIRERSELTYPKYYEDFQKMLQTLVLKEN